MADKTTHTDNPEHKGEKHAEHKGDAKHDAPKEHKGDAKHDAPKAEHKGDGKHVEHKGDAKHAEPKAEHKGKKSAGPIGRKQHKGGPRREPKPASKATVTVIDATGLVLGRMATHVAKRAIEGDEVHIVNAEKAIIVGSSKKAIQEHYLFKRHVGTSRKGPFFPREPHLIVKRTCRGMINYTSSDGRAAYKRIKAHLGVPKELANTKAASLDHARREARQFLTIAELASWLGRPTKTSYNKEA